MKIRIVQFLVLTIITAGYAAEPHPQRIWVYFRDKGYSTPEALRAALKAEEDRLLPATWTRLLKVRSPQDLLDEADLPIYPSYLQEIERLTGLKPHAVSRTINAASYALGAHQIATLQNLDFVKTVQPVRRLKNSLEPDGNNAEIEGSPRFLQDSLFYGGSYLQNALENFPPAHEAGYTGQGVLVGMLDAGWDNLAHVCFDSLEIVATRDFVNGDLSVANDTGQVGSGWHGTRTLSCLAGYDPGDLIGTAYDISVALAKTENVDLPDTSWEEDNWVAGIEWLDSLGCVIVTSSVSYGDLHDYSELDGNTTVISIAADYAVARGIVVLNSVGNDGNYAYPQNKINPPADGDSVLSIGAVNAQDLRWDGSSLGPTYDGQIKPDLMALGINVLTAISENQTGYDVHSGTSLSTPLTAGACALLLQADPSLAPMQVHQYLKDTGDQAANPDTLRGWGVYNVWQAVQDALNASAVKTTIQQPAQFQMLSVYPNPFNSSAQVMFTLPAAGWVNGEVFDLLGRKVAGFASGYYSAGRQEVHWPAANLTSGIYYIFISSPWGVQKYKAIALK